MHRLRLLLLPLAWSYGAVLRLRHALYDRGVLASATPRPATIVVGNIALGGTGKTPMVELVLRTLIGHGTLATLSRGYGRRGTELREVQRQDDAADVGDEPLMIKRHFSGVRVFVGADRLAAVAAMADRVPDLRAVVLDDALQHRRLRAGLNIALTTYHRPWHRDHLLPAGNLRDLRQRGRRADAVVVTKCPMLPTRDEQRRWRQRLGIPEHTPLFFSQLVYDAPTDVHDPGTPVPTGPSSEALLFTGIADPRPLLEHARKLFGTVRHINFPDHHRFSSRDLDKLARVFGTFAGPNKTLLTTEKDFARLGTALLSGPLEDLPLAVIGIRATILNSPFEFDALLRTHVATHSPHR